MVSIKAYHEYICASDKDKRTLCYNQYWLFTKDYKQDAYNPNTMSQPCH